MLDEPSRGLTMTTAAPNFDEQQARAQAEHGGVQAEQSRGQVPESGPEPIPDWEPEPLDEPVPIVQGGQVEAMAPMPVSIPILMPRAEAPGAEDPDPTGAIPEAGDEPAAATPRGVRFARLAARLRPGFGRLRGGLARFRARGISHRRMAAVGLVSVGCLAAAWMPKPWRTAPASNVAAEVADGKVQAPRVPSLNIPNPGLAADGEKGAGSGKAEDAKDTGKAITPTEVASSTINGDERLQTAVHQDPVPEPEASTLPAVMPPETAPTQIAFADQPPRGDGSLIGLNKPPASLKVLPRQGKSAHAEASPKAVAEPAIPKADPPASNSAPAGSPEVAKADAAVEAPKAAAPAAQDAPKVEAPEPPKAEAPEAPKVEGPGHSDAPKPGDLPPPASDGAIPPGAGAPALAPNADSADGHGPVAEANPEPIPPPAANPAAGPEPAAPVPEAPGGAPVALPPPDPGLVGLPPSGTAAPAEQPMPDALPSAGAPAEAPAPSTTELPAPPEGMLPPLDPKSEQAKPPEDAPKATAEAPKDLSAAEAPKPSPAAEMPKEPMPEAPKAPAADAPKDPKAEAPKQDPTAEASKQEPKAEEPKPSPPVEEPTAPAAEAAKAPEQPAQPDPEPAPPKVPLLGEPGPAELPEAEPAPQPGPKSDKPDPFADLLAPPASPNSNHPDLGAQPPTPAPAAAEAPTDLPPAAAQVPATTPGKAPASPAAAPAVLPSMEQQPAFPSDPTASADEGPINDPSLNGLGQVAPTAKAKVEVQVVPVGKAPFPVGEEPGEAPRANPLMEGGSQPAALANEPPMANLPPATPAPSATPTRATGDGWVELPNEEPAPAPRKSAFDEQPKEEPAPASAPPSSPRAEDQVAFAGDEAALEKDEFLEQRPQQQELEPEQESAPKKPKFPTTEAFEPVPHVVQRGENFWTISKSYYGDGRYYQALWAANSEQVPRADALVVGASIWVPPVELLDRRLIPLSAGARASSRTASTEPEAAPKGSATRIAPPLRVPPPESPSTKLVSSRPEPQPDPDFPDFAEEERPKRAEKPEANPFDEEMRDPAPAKKAEDYRVRQYETLRSIARDVLGDSSRDRELYELNKDRIDDPYRLEPGTILRLPNGTEPPRRR